MKWANIVAAHEQAVNDWKVDHMRLQAENVKVKDFPPKPKQPLKPKPVLETTQKDKGNLDDNNNDLINE